MRGLLRQLAALHATRRFCLRSVLCVSRSTACGATRFAICLLPGDSGHYRGRGVVSTYFAKLLHFCCFRRCWYTLETDTPSVWAIWPAVKPASVSRATSAPVLVRRVSASPSVCRRNARCSSTKRFVAAGCLAFTAAIVSPSRSATRTCSANIAFRSLSSASLTACSPVRRSGLARQFA